MGPRILSLSAIHAQSKIHCSSQQDPAEQSRLAYHSSNSIRRKSEELSFSHRVLQAPPQDDGEEVTECVQRRVLVHVSLDDCWSGERRPTFSRTYKLNSHIFQSRAACSKFFRFNFSGVLSPRSASMRFNTNVTSSAVKNAGSPHRLRLVAAGHQLACQGLCIRSHT